MHTFVKYKQFDFEHLKNGNLYVSFRPFSSRLSKKQFSVLLTKGTEYMCLALSVEKGICSDFEMRHLADFIETYDGHVINSI